MSKLNIETLIAKSIKGELSPEERVEFGLWLKNDSNSELYQELKVIWDKTGEINLDVDHEIDIQEALKITKQKIKVQKSPTISLSPSRRRPYLLAASFAIIAILFGGLILRLSNTTDYVSILAMENKEIVLPDNSIVFLSKGSSIKYPDVFDANRTIELRGKAMFDVTHNPKSPFTVTTKNLDVTVLGTKFIVNDEANQKDYVSVIEGKVQVHDLKNSKADNHILLANDAVSRDDKEILVSNEITDNSMYWASRRLSYNDISLVALFKELEMYHDIKIDVSNNLSECLFTGKFSDTDLSSIIENLTFIYSLSIKQTNNSYTVTGKPC